MFVGGFSIASLSLLLLFDWQILPRGQETPAFRVRSLTDLFFCAKLFLEIERVRKRGEKKSKENNYKIVK